MTRERKTEARSRFERSETDAAVWDELFQLNMRDELGNRTELSPEEWQEAFERALHNTSIDMPQIEPRNDKIEVAKTGGSQPPTLRTRLFRYVIATMVALIVAAIIRLAALAAIVQ